MPWPQNYDPLGNPWLSTALPVAVLLSLLAWGHLRAWLAKLSAPVSALDIALFAGKTGSRCCQNRTSGDLPAAFSLRTHIDVTHD